jgi:hypothetical protein
MDRRKGSFDTSFAGTPYLRSDHNQPVINHTERLACSNFSKILFALLTFKSK